MTKRIFWYIFGFVLTLYFVIIGITVAFFYDGLCTETRSELKVETSIAAQGVEKSGMDYFDGLDTTNYRITWIDSDGTVLYDSTSSQITENHLNREEVQEALKTGYGESSRYSDTIMKTQYYSAQKIADGTVVRLSISHDSVWVLLIKLIYPIAYSSIAIIGVCIWIAYIISKKIVRPLNNINLDEPTKNTKYKELQPLLNRLEVQQASIRLQEKELKRRQEEFYATTSQMKEGLILVDEKDEVINKNPAASKLLKEGVTIQQLEKEKDFDRADRSYHVDVTPIEDHGKVILVRDITEKAQAESMRRDFTANVSHELKTPLQSISGRAELLMDGLVKEEDKPKFIEQIYDESKRMITLIEDIIRLSSLEEKSDFVKEPVEFWALVRETAYSLKQQADKAEVRLSVEGAPVTIQAVPRLVTVIVYNLIDNAIKYNKPQGSVDVVVKEEEDNAVLYVKDTGIGIPAEDQDRIFERFYRVDKSRSKSVGGTGLGLSIVKHAAKILDAEIGLNSTVGVGTTIVVKFKK